MNSVILRPPRVLGEALVFAAKKHPSKTAIIAKDAEYPYFDLYSSAEKLARTFVTAGILKGDRIAIYMDNSWEATVSVYASSLAGAVFLVINPQTKSDKLKYILDDSEAKILISATVHRKEYEPAVADSRHITHVIVNGDLSASQKDDQLHWSTFDDALENSDENAMLPLVIPNDLAALIYTSGSTGFPKGVMMTHQAMVFTCGSLVEYLRLTPDERIMLLLPLAFDYGLYQLLMSVTIGATLIVEQSFIFIASVYKNINKYKPTVFPGVPTIYAMMIASHKETGLSFDFVEKITNTAAMLPAESIPYLQKIFPNALIFKMYGLTECKRVCYLEPELIDIKPQSVGKAIPGTEVFLLTPNGKPVPAGQPGILHVRGPHVMLGYLNKENLTNEMLRDGKLPGEKILCSNDWFKMDEDGDLYFLGRNDDIIKTRGEKVSPVEVENVIYKIPQVKEVAVMGVPDTLMGESITVFITLHGAVSITEKEIKRECMKHLESFMIPQNVIFMPQMPKSTNGKIDKHELRKLCETSA